MTFHKDTQLGDQHIIHNWEYTDTAAREASTGFVASDVYKLALQLDDGSFWMLTATTPTWQQITGGVGGGPHTIASHSDTSATGAELDTLTDTSDADALHVHALADAHIADTANPHGTDLGNLGTGTLAELNALVTDATLDDAGDPRTPAAHTIASHSDTTATGAELDTLTDNSDADGLHIHAINDAKLTADATNVAAAGAVMDSDITPAEGMLRKTGAGTYTAHKSNLGAVTNPGTGDDNTAGYGVFSWWVNVTGGSVWVCEDAGTGVANWLDVTATGGIVTHASTTGQTADDHHAEVHTIASHSDTTATGAELDQLTGGGDANGLHMHESALRSSTTGLLSGMVCTVDTSTTIDISAGTGVVVDYSDPVSPAFTEVDFSEVLGQTLPDIATTTQTLVTVNAAGAVELYSDTGPTDLQYKDLIIIGSVLHPFGTILTINTRPENLGYNAGNTALDFIRKIVTPANIAGNLYSANGANLNIDVTAGTGFILNSNFRNDPQVPDIVPDTVLTADTALTFSRSYQDGSGATTLVTGQTAIDPDQYDDGDGGLAAVPVNDWTIQRIFRFDGGTTIVAYGQEVFDTLATAMDALGRELFVETQPLNVGMFRGYLIVQEGATDLSDTGEAAFLEAPAFRLTGVGGSSSISPLVPVDSVFGRTAAVVAAASDYDASQVDNDSGVTGAFVSDALDTLDAGKAPNAHTVVSHSDTTATGPELDTLTDGSDADGLHAHAGNDAKLTADATNVAAAGAVMDSDIAPAEGMLQKTGAGAYTAHKSNLGAVTDPGTSDDNTAGYGVFSWWVNTTGGSVWVCEDAGTGVANWLDVTATGGIVTHASTTGQTADDHHNELHSVASHNDTTATGPELDTLTDGSDADGLHAHAGNDAKLTADATNVAAAGAVMDSDITPAEGMLQKTGAGTYTAHKSNLGAVTDPGTGDDNTAGYGVFSWWVNVTGGSVWVCEDAGTGVANWLDVTATGGIVTHASTTGQTADDHHAEVHTIVSHDTTATGANLTTLTDGSNADSLHVHSALPAHGIASHSDTTATGAQLNTLVGTGDADSLHAHAVNDAKVSNATHTGDVTGSVALTIAALAVENGMLSATAVTVGKIDDEGAADGQVPTSDGAGGVAWETPAGSGDVVGPAGSVTENTIPRNDGTTGELLQASNVLIDDLDNVSAMQSLHVQHTAVEDDDFALKITANGGGFGGVKGLDIDVVTGAIAAGEDEEAALIQVDQSASTGGRVVAVEVLTTTTGTAEVDAIEVGPGVHPLLQLSGSFGDLDSLLVLAVDQLTALSTGGAGNVPVFSNDNDTITFGDTAQYQALEIIVDTPASGNGIAGTFEYSTGIGTWAAFSPADGTDGARQTGVILWELADIPSWATGTGGWYLIRWTRTRNTLTTTPILDLCLRAVATLYTWDNQGDLAVNNIAPAGTVDGRNVAADGTAQDSHIADTANPHSTDIGNLGAGTLAELNATVTDATLDDASASRTPSAHTIASHSDTTATGPELDTLTDSSNADSLHVHDHGALAGLADDDHTQYVLVDGTRPMTGVVIVEATTARTLVDADAGRTIYTTQTSAVTITVPDSLASGFTCNVHRGASGSVTFVAGGTATIVGSDLSITDEGGIAAVLPTNIADTYRLAGGLGVLVMADITDTTAAGAELDTLTDGSDADALHVHALADAHIADTANPHATDLGNLGPGTLAELNALVTDGTLDTTSDSRTPAAHTIASHSDTTATGPNLNTLTDGSDADGLHAHAGNDAKLTADATNVAAAGAVMDSDITPAEGLIRKTGAGTYTAHKTNYTAVIDPVVGDDNTAGYSIGSWWINVTGGSVWVCEDAATGAANWLDVTATGGIVTHASTTGRTADDHHAEVHTIASHSDTTATGPNLNTLTDGSDADALHDHAINDAKLTADATNVAAAGAIMDSEAAGTYAGSLIRTGSAAYAVLKHNLAASTAPTVTDDSASDYGVGSLWIDTTADNVYQATNVGVGVADWKHLNAAAAGGGLPTASYVTSPTSSDYYEGATTVCGGAADFIVHFWWRNMNSTVSNNDVIVDNLVASTGWRIEQSFGNYTATAYDGGGAAVAASTGGTNPLYFHNNDIILTLRAYQSASVLNVELFMNGWRVATATPGAAGMTASTTGNLRLAPAGRGTQYAHEGLLYYEGTQTEDEITEYTQACLDAGQMLPLISGTENNLWSFKDNTPTPAGTWLPTTGADNLTDQGTTTAIDDRTVKPW